MILCLWLIELCVSSQYLNLNARKYTICLQIPSQNEIIILSPASIYNKFVKKIVLFSEKGVIKDY